MAELISAFVNVVMEKLVIASLDQITPSKELHSELKKWERSLSQIRAVLNDASYNEVTDEAVKQLLNSLHHLAYDIDDILDEMATEAMHREFTRESEPITNKIRKLLPTCFTRFTLSTSIMDGKLSNITTKLQELVDEKSNLGLSMKDGQQLKNKNRCYQTSFVHVPSIIGRESDKEKLVNKLLGDDEPCNQNFSIVPIFGMGGIGKTTLARLLYDDKRVKEHFELKAWVCVSDEFDSFKISEVIFQSISGETKEFKDLNLLQEALRRKVEEKRFLLVLDDVWSDKLEDWETLIGPFYEGSPGSKIIITTRKKELLRQLGHNHPYELQKLSHNDALTLFFQYAGITVYDYETLRQHGEGIVKKCDGLPLALKTLGSLLRTKVDEEEWKEVLNNEIWTLKAGDCIVPALRLSYQDLFACLKQLFAYCSLFPKDYVFEKDDLILLWMAEGFLHQTSTNKSMERLGEEYFQELLSRSFFQHVPDDKKSLFVMHDLINDLATFVAGEFFVRLDTEMEKDYGAEALKKYRHMSFVRGNDITYKKFNAFERASSLRAFLVVPIAVRDSQHTFFSSCKILVDLLPNLPLLRVLSLSHIEINEVPECVGNMKHLRYLNLSRTRITHLPENVCNIYNLQTLIVFGCIELTMLPENFLKLKNLRHFDIRKTLLWKVMPLGISEWKSLQILSNINIAEDDDFPISGLKNFKNLKGTISISGLEKVKSARDVQEANLSQKRVSELKLMWSNKFDNSRNETLEKEVLSALMPHSDNMKDLEIKSYGGKELPTWIGDASFVRLSSVSISGCRKCTILPLLGKLSSLKELSIERMDEVKFIGSEFLGTGPAFPSLEILSFRDLRVWENWSTIVGVAGAVVFPRLKVLTLKKCPNLTKVSLQALPRLETLKLETCPSLAEVSLVALPSLKVLDISNCSDGVLTSLIHVAPSVTKLTIKGISGLTDKVWVGVTEYLKAVEEISIWECNEIKYMLESEAESSKLVKIEDCDQLREKELMLLSTRMSVLQVVWIMDLHILKSIYSLETFIHLTHLYIYGCLSIESFPAELPNLTSLEYLMIVNCKSMDVGSFVLWPPKLCTLFIGLLKKPISMWGSQKFPSSLVDLTLKGGSAEEEDDVTNGSQLSHFFPSSLTKLNLWGFKKLESVSKGLEHLTSLQHLYIWGSPKMKDLPETLLPSLLSLTIEDCTEELKEKTSRSGSYWSLVSHIPKIDIK